MAAVAKIVEHQLWTAAEADAATKGYSTQPWRAGGVSIDSRSIAPGDLFIAIEGPKFDGHEFVSEALDRGAAVAMVSRIPRNLVADSALLIVGNTFTGLGNLARAARNRTQAHVFAITGSVGKTGTKDMLKLALDHQGLTTANARSLNNQWGVPLSLCRMPADAAFGIFEIGMNHAGEIMPLANLVRPMSAIVTTVTGAHMAHFTSVEGIAAAKAEIFTGMDGGNAILNRDNRFFPMLSAAARDAGIARIISFGADDDADVRLIDCTAEDGASRVTAEINGHGLNYRLGALGRHWALNSLAVLAAVAAAGADIDAAAAALVSMTAPKGRGVQHQVPLNGGSFTLFDDSYNASPASMEAAFALLAAAAPGEGGRRIAILGDMLELGANSKQLHAALAEGLVAAGIDLVCTAGDHMINLDDALPRRMRGGHDYSVDRLLALVRNLIGPGDMVLVKGSQGSRMGLIVDGLLSDADAPKPAVNGL